MTLPPFCSRWRFPAALILTAFTLSTRLALPTAHAAPALVDTIDLSPGQDPTGLSQIALNGNTHRLFVLGLGTSGINQNSTIKVIDTNAGSVRSGITFGDSNDGRHFAPQQMALDDATDANGNKLYVIGHRVNNNDYQMVLRTVDGGTDASLSSGDTDLKVGADSSYYTFGYGMTVNPVTHHVYVFADENSLFVVDGPGRRVLSRMSIGLNRVRVTAVSRATNKVFFFGESKGAVILDGATEVATPLAAPIASVAAAVVDEAAKRVYVIGSDLGTVVQKFYVLDAATGAVVTSTPLNLPVTPNPLGDRPYRANSLTLDPATHTLYVGCDETFTRAYDAATLTPKQDFPFSTGGLAFDATAGGARLYSLNVRHGVGVLDLATSAFSKITATYIPGPMAANTRTGRVFVLDEGTNEVVAIDAASRTVVGRFPISNGEQKYEATDDRTIAVSSALNRFYVTHLDTRTLPRGSSVQTENLDAYDGDDGHLIQSVEISANGYVHNGFIAVDDNARRIYVTGAAYVDNAETFFVFVLDADTHALLTSINLGINPPFGLAVNPVTHRLYYASSQGRKLVIIDGVTNAVVQTISGTDFGNVTVNTRTNKIYVATYPNAVTVIDGAKDAVDSTFYNTHQNKHDTVNRIVVDEATNTLYILDNNDRFAPSGRVTFFDGNNQSFLGQIELGYLPVGLAFDPASRRVFASNDYDGTISVIQADGAGAAHAPFFAGESALGNGVYFLRFGSGNPFGYYSYLSDPHYVYHFDLGYEYVFDASDGHSGVYLYDFKSGGFFYTSPSFPFPYLYDFSLNTVLYYFPDPNNEGRYNTNGIRYFVRLDTGEIISK